MSNPRIKVCSFMRSGTHFLMAALWKNFELGDEGRPARGRQWAENGKNFANVPWGHLWGTHSPIQACNIPIENVVYIFRNPYDTLISLWHYKEARCTFDQWAHEKTIQRWYEHVKGYADAGAYLVKYEVLREKYGMQLGHIEGRFHLARKDAEWQPVDELVGWKPHAAKMNQGRRLRKELRERFASIIPEGFCGYKIA